MGLKDQLETIRAMAPTDEFFETGDPRRVTCVFDESNGKIVPQIDWRKILKAYLTATPHTEILTFIDTILELTVDERIALLTVDEEATGMNGDPHMMDRPEGDEPEYAFTTDGCSGGMTLLWEFVSHEPPPWNDLCVEHDRKYWRGGSAADRRKADRELLAGVALNGHPVFAVLMWLAVRPGGHPLLPLPWRWGYGYQWPRGYR